MTSSAAFTTVIAGGGPAALEAALTLREIAPAMHVELLAADGEYVYRPLSVVEPFGLGGVRRYPYGELAGLGVHVRHGRLAGVDAGERLVMTADGAEVSYDALLIAVGARRRPALPRCTTFGGPEDVERMHGLVQDLEGDHVRDLLFAAPEGADWTLPLYELALQTAERADELCLDSARIRLVSHEREPLEVFGTAASELMRGLLGKWRVEFVGGGGIPAAERIVALPVPVGPRVAGLPADAAGFLPTGAHGEVEGTTGVWAAGDCTSHPIKQGGLATQQAAAAAASIAHAAGMAASPEHDDPVLRAMFVSRRQAYFLRRRLDGIDPGQASPRALWWPPSKIAGQRIAPYLDGLDAAASRESFERQHAEGPVVRRLFAPKARA